MGSFREPPGEHGELGRPAVLLINLGTPDAPTTKAVRRYLKQFLSDPRVVEIPRAIWWWILHGVILPFRSINSAQKYAAIWTNEGSPLKVHTSKQASLLGACLEQQGQPLSVAYAMRYGSPSIAQVLQQLQAAGCDRILILPAYPQYSATTTASIYDAVFAHCRQVRNLPELRLIKHYYDHPAYIDALQESVLAHWAQHGKADKLIISFHGTPKRTLLLGDPYYWECQKTGHLLAQQLGLGAEQYQVTFQSRFGKAEWLQPYTASTLIALAKQGVGRVDVICPGFIADCLETLEEIGLEVKQEFLAAGGQEFHFITCLNESPRWIDAMATIVQQNMPDWLTVRSSRN